MAAELVLQCLITFYHLWNIRLQAVREGSCICGCIQNPTRLHTGKRRETLLPHPWKAFNIPFFLPLWLFSLSQRLQRTASPIEANSLSRLYLLSRLGMFWPSALLCGHPPHSWCSYYPHCHWPESSWALFVALPGTACDKDTSTLLLLFAKFFFCSFCSQTII